MLSYIAIIDRHVVGELSSQAEEAWQRTMNQPLLCGDGTPACDGGGLCWQSAVKNVLLPLWAFGLQLLDPDSMLAGSSTRHSSI